MLGRLQRTIKRLLPHRTQRQEQLSMIRRELEHNKVELSELVDIDAGRRRLSDDGRGVADTGD